MTVSHLLNRTSQVSPVTKRRLLHTVDAMPAGEAAQLLATLPSGLAARVLAHAAAYHGVLIVAALGPRHVQHLVDVLPENSGSRRQLRDRLFDCWYTGRFAGVAERPEPATGVVRPRSTAVSRRPRTGH